MEEGKTCSAEGCDAGAECEKCEGCGGHCKCGADTANAGETEKEEVKTADAGEGMGGGSGESG